MPSVGFWLFVVARSKAVSRAAGGLEAAMIRKLKSGGYRLYSRKTNPKTGRRRNLGTFQTRAAARSMSARCSTSSATEAAIRRVCSARENGPVTGM